MQLFYSTLQAIALGEMTRSWDPALHDRMCPHDDFLESTSHTDRLESAIEQFR